MRNLHVLPAEKPSGLKQNKSTNKKYEDFWETLIPEEEAKQETLEKYIEREFQFNSSTVIQNQEYVYLMNKNRFKIAVNNILKYQKEQDKNKYSEEEVLNFTQTMIMQYKFGNTNIEQMDLLKETLQQFKNK